MYKVSILWKELRDFLLLWLTQSLSGLGSAMTSYALIVWSYQQEGSALSTALLSICSYAPYVVMSIFAGALSDRWNKKRTLLWCDSFAAATTVAVLLMLRLGTLRLEYLYLINALNGLMNTIQQPAADVVNTLLTPKKHYQRVSGLRSLSSSAQSLLTPVLATALLAFAELEAVLVVDLATFVLAFATLLGCIRIPPMPNEGARPEKVLLAARQGLRYLKGNPGILHLMLFLAAINLTASMYEAALPALLLNRGGEVALGMVSTVCGLAMLAGSLLASALPAPRSRIRVICNTLLLSMSTENLLLAVGPGLPYWCVGAALGWIGIPLMQANLDVVMRSHIPLEMQGRVWSARNTLQFFTIPLGYFLGGWLVDRVFEPLLASAVSPWIRAVFGTGKGAGAAAFFLVLFGLGLATCLAFRKDRALWRLEIGRDAAGGGMN